MPKKMTALALAMLLLALCCPGAMAGATIDRIAETGTIRVGTSPTMPPLSAKGKNGMLMGFDIDLANILASAMGVELRFVELPFGELLEAVNEDKVDMVISGVTMLPKRNMKVVFAGPYLIGGQTVLGTNALMAAINGRDDLNKAHYTVAVAKGTTAEDAAQGVLGKAKIVLAADEDAALKLLLDKKVDMVVADMTFAAMAAFRYAKQDLAVIGKPFTFEPFGIAIKPGDPQLQNLLDNFLVTFHGSGQQQFLQARWFQRASWMKDLAQ